MLYQRNGAALARLLDLDIERAVPAVLRLLLQMENEFELGVMGAGNSTGSMQALAALIQWPLGETLYGLCAFSATAAFLGQLALYSVVRRLATPSLLVPSLLCILMVPSVVFWSSGFLKEPLAFAGLGLMAVGASQLLRSRRLAGPCCIVAGAGIVLLFKAYIVLAFAVAGGAAYVVAKMRERKRRALGPAYLAVGILFAYGLMAIVAEVNPRYAVTDIAEEAARLQGANQYTSGGSDIDFGDASKGSVIGQVALAPLALMNALFRPSLLDVRSPVMALSAMETTAGLLVFVAALLRPRRSVRIFRELTKRPEWVFSAVFVFVLALGVGLASTNLGTIARYRTPFVPLYALILLWAIRASRSLFSTAPNATGIMRSTASLSRPPPHTRLPQNPRL